MDLSFTALITLAAFFLSRFFDAEDSRALWYASIALGVAALIKGPMAPVIGVVLFALEWWRRRRAPRANYALAIITLIAIPLLWFVPAVIGAGGGYANDVLKKQIAGRAVGAWVHASPPWTYIAHSPGFLFPWFILGVTAIVTRWRTQRFNVNWILAVLIPYSLMSSKLDVYMMALIPPLSIVIADAVEHAITATQRANLAMLIAFIVISAVGMSANVRGIPPGVSLKPLCVVLAIASALGIAFSLRGAIASTLAVGLVPIVTLILLALTLLPVANEMASTRPLIRTLSALNVPPEQIALYTCPYLWSRDMPRDLERVRYVGAASLASANARVVVTARKHAGEIDLRGFQKSGELQMIGKWFDVYRR
jgi:4-amino-4-deoxy-L-arabinose transferase-like glycosyltransferase